VRAASEEQLAAVVGRAAARKVRAHYMPAPPKDFLAADERSAALPQSNGEGVHSTQSRGEHAENNFTADAQRRRGKLRKR